jgi:predicted peroxiredoxin
MSDKFCVNLTHYKDDADKATVGFVIANAALGSEKETSYFLPPRASACPKRDMPRTFTKRASFR